MFYGCLTPGAILKARSPLYEAAWASSGSIRVAPSKRLGGGKGLSSRVQLPMASGQSEPQLVHLGSESASLGVCAWLDKL